MTIMDDVEALTQSEVSASLDRPLLERQLAYVLANSPFYREKVGALAAGPPEALALWEAGEWPFTEKREIIAEQEAYPPYGRLATGDSQDALCRIHVTSGSTGRPLYVALTHRDVEATREASRRAFRCAGLTPDDCVVHCLSYCLWAGGVTDHLGLEATGATVIPFGVGHTHRLIETILALRPSALSCTPSYVSRLEVVLKDEFGLAPPDLHLKKAFFGGEGGLQNPGVRRRIEDLWQMQAIDANYGMADVLSHFGAECEARQGLHFHGQGILQVELIDPGSLEVIPLETGRTGELVLTNLCREAQPLVRFRTRDLIRILGADRCACGRGSFRFLVVGRSDHMIVVRGVNVFPGAVKSLLSEQPERFSGEFEFVLETPPPIERPLLRAELAGEPAAFDLPEVERSLIEACRSRLSFTPRVELLGFGQLPRTEGKSKHVRKLYEEA